MARLLDRTFNYSSSYYIFEKSASDLSTFRLIPHEISTTITAADNNYSFPVPETFVRMLMTQMGVGPGGGGGGAQ